MKKITTEELCKVTTEGLILQGCGGKPQEWLDGINEMLTESEILQNGSKFTEVSIFEHDGATNLLFDMENVDLNIGKLAMWRIHTHEKFGGKWLSDYTQNRFNVEMGKGTGLSPKPDCPLIGADGNVFNLMGIASKTLNRAGQQEQAKIMCERIRNSGSYGDALNILGEYVNITSVDDMDQAEPAQGFTMKGY